MNHHRESFDGLGAFTTFAADHGGKGRTATDWNGNCTLPEACSLAAAGWREGCGKINATLAALQDDIGSLAIVPAIRRVDCGGEIDVAAYLTGEPEHYIMPEQTMAPSETGRALTIGFCCTVSGVVSADELTRRGAAVAALIASLEVGGYAVKLDVILSTSSKPRQAGHTAVATVPVKRFGGELDIASLAFTCAHPAFLRQLGFAFYQYAADKHGTGTGFDAGYGYPYTPELDGYDLLIPALHTGSWSKDETAAWLKEQWQALGIVSG